MDVALTDSELLAFCGLARLLVRLDGVVSPQEQEALELIGPELSARTSPTQDAYRTVLHDHDVRESRFWDTMTEAAETFKNAQQVQQAALAVTRPEARETIYGALFDLASSDAIVKEEWALLMWLSTNWALQTP